MNKIIFTEKDAYSIFCGFLDCLHSLSNKEIQERSWGNEDYSIYTDFSEVSMCFLDSCEGILNWSELPSKQRKNLQKLYDLVENYDEYLPNRKKNHKEIHFDPEWDKIRRFAREIYNELKNVEYVPDDD